MKGYFLEKWNKVCRHIYLNRKSIIGTIYIVWIVVVAIISYNKINSYQNAKMLDVETINSYKDIIQQIVDGDIKNIQIPKYTKIELYQNSIVVSNVGSSESVSGDFTGIEVTFTKEDGKIWRIIETAFWFLVTTFVVGLGGGLFVHSIVEIILERFQEVWKNRE